MIDIIINSASAILMGAGSIFILIGALGLVRLPDFYTRMHAAGVTDTLGAELLLLGMMLQAGLSLVTLKLVLISLFIFFTSPTSTHAVANATRVMGLRLVSIPEDDLTSKEKIRGAYARHGYRCRCCFTCTFIHHCISNIDNASFTCSSRVDRSF